MAWRFRRSWSPFPGFRFNFSKGGVSVSLGRPGATVNIGKQGVVGTVGIPGTGLSWRERLDRPRNVVPLPPARDPAIPTHLYRRIEALERKMDEEDAK